MKPINLRTSRGDFRTDQAEDLAALNRQADIIHCQAFCEFFAEVADFDDRGHGSTTS
jgi:phage terminase large subunit-like protein